jgi:hypothetical protein
MLIKRYQCAIVCWASAIVRQPLKQLALREPLRETVIIEGAVETVIIEGAWLREGYKGFVDVS